MNQGRQPKRRLVVRSSSPALKIVVTVLIVFSMAALVAVVCVGGSSFIQECLPQSLIQHFCKG